MKEKMKCINWEFTKPLIVVFLTGLLIICVSLLANLPDTLWVGILLLASLPFSLIGGKILHPSLNLRDIFCDK